MPEIYFSLMQQAGYQTANHYVNPWQMPDG